MTQDSATTARFGVFEADIKTGELRKAGRKLRLQDQPFRVLAVLIDKSGELVTRQELQERIWPDDTYIDFDHALTTAVKKLRRVLQDSPSQPRYIETLPKKGYRFIAPVEFMPSLPGDGEPVAEKNGNGGSQPDALHRLRIQRNVLLVLLAVAAVGSLWWLLRPVSPVAELPARLFSFAPESVGGEGRRHVAISPDGRYIVYVDSGEETSLWLRRLDRQGSYRLGGTEGATAPFWSPDSQFIAFGTPTHLKKVSIHGGAPMVLCRIASGIYMGGAWSPDGEALIFSAGLPPVMREVAAGGGEPVIVSEPIVTTNGGSNFDVSFLPSASGERRVFLAVGGPAGREIAVMDLATGSHKLVGRGSYPVYAEPGYILYQLPGPDGGVWALPFSLETLEATGPAEPLIDDGYQPSLAGDGTLVYMDRIATASKQQLVLKDRSGERLRVVGRAHGGIQRPRFSPGGEQILMRVSEREEYDIWIQSTHSPSLTRVTSDPVVEGDPVWSPDGKEVIYRADVTLSTELMRVRLGGSAPPERLDVPGLAKRPTDWSPDGRHVVYAANDDQTRGDLWLLPFKEDGTVGEPVPLVRTPFNEVSGRISPDGRYMAYCSDESGQYELYVTTFPKISTRWHASLAGGCQPRWGSDGRELFYVDNDTLIAVEIDTGDGLKTGRTHVLFRDPNLTTDSPHAATYDVSPDGKRFVLRETERPLAAEPPSIYVLQNWAGAFRDVFPQEASRFLAR